MKVTLRISGREMTFSDVEAISINEENLSSETKKNVNDEVAQKPTEGKWFEVNSQTISQELFKKKREDSRQERTRRLILEAFAEVKNNPEKYAKPFETMIPKKTWNVKSVIGLKELAREFGDHNADWVEQALEWAQRISNGESWEEICNNVDTSNWYRIVVWKNDHVRLVGGSCKCEDYKPASYVLSDSFNSSNNRLTFSVPLVVRYK